MKTNGQHSRVPSDRVIFIPQKGQNGDLPAGRTERVSLFIPVTPNGEPHEVHMQKIREAIRSTLAGAGLNHEKTSLANDKIKSPLRGIFVDCISREVAEKARQVIAGIPYVPSDKEKILILM